MNKKGITLLLAVALAAASATAQGTKGLRINEVMVTNVSNCVDDYGQRTAWIELYNSTYGTMKISSVYITNDKNDPTKYAVPRGDERMVIAPLQHALFYADGEDGRGPFHLNFTLQQGVENWIGIYEADGVTLIDEVYIPADLPSDWSYALKVDGNRAQSGNFDPSYWEKRNGLGSSYVTPGSSNFVVKVNDSVEKFRNNDKSGIVLTLMAMGIVFSALIVLSLCFFIFGRLNERGARKRKAAAISTEDAPTNHKQVKGDSGEAIAAIAMALYQHINVHDKEDTVLTINKVKRVYSPWSSKIYTLREIPRR